MKKQLIGLFVAGLMTTIAASAHVDSVDDLQNRNITSFGLVGNKIIALTFDDGPGNGTEKVLNTLKKYNVKATFFALGAKLKQYPKLAQRIVDEGHVLANHSYSHQRLASDAYARSPKLLITDLVDTHKEIEKFSPDKNFYYFRAPGGAWKNGYADVTNVSSILRKYIGPIYWDVGGAIVESNGKATDAADWACWGKANAKYNDINVCLDGYMARIESLKGGNILMHDIHNKTADMFELMLPLLIKKGYQFVTMEEVEELKNYERVQSDEFFRSRAQTLKAQRSVK